MASVSQRISSGSRYFHGERYGSRRLTKAAPHLSGFTRILAPGAGRAVNNKLSHFVSGARASGRAVCGGGALHACSRTIDQPGRAGKGVEEEGAGGRDGPGSKSARKKESGAPN